MNGFFIIDLGIRNGGLGGKVRGNIIRVVVGKFAA